MVTLLHIKMEKRPQLSQMEMGRNLKIKMIKRKKENRPHLHLLRQVRYFYSKNSQYQYRVNKISRCQINKNLFYHFSEDESMKKSDNIVITHSDTTAVAEGGVTVSTGIAPVDLQPNVSVTPVHSESATSYSVSSPDANTQVNHANISFVLREGLLS